MSFGYSSLVLHRGRRRPPGPPPLPRWTCPHEDDEVELRRHGALRDVRKSVPTTGGAPPDGLLVTASVLILVLFFLVLLIILILRLVMVFTMAFNILERERVERICGIPVISAGCATAFILSFNTLERGREMEILGLGFCHPTMVKQAIHQSSIREVMNRQVLSRTCRSFLFFRSLPRTSFRRTIAELIGNLQALTALALFTRRGLALGRGLHSMRPKTLWSRR